MRTQTSALAAKPNNWTRMSHYWNTPRFSPLFYEPVYTVHGGPSFRDVRHFKVATRVNLMAAVLYDLPVVGSVDQSLWGSPLSPCVAVASAAPSPPIHTPGWSCRGPGRLILWQCVWPIVGVGGHTVRRLFWTQNSLYASLAASTHPGSRNASSLPDAAGS